jgi:hypothetical protein
MEDDLKFTVSRGKEVGVVLTPHRHEDGKYVASMTRFQVDYVRVETVRELRILAKQGFSIRMSNPDSENHRSPSLIAPASLGV